MKHKRLFIHLLSIGILAAGLCLSILIQPEPGGYVRLAKYLAMVALVFILASLLMNGKVVPLMTACGYFLSFLFAFFFQRDGVDPGGGSTNNFWGLWIIAFFTFFVLSLYFETVYAHKRLQ